MKIYLAGPCDSENRSMMIHAAKIIRNCDDNIELYCPFELKIENAWDYSQEEWAQMVFDIETQPIAELQMNKIDINYYIQQIRSIYEPKSFYEKLS